MVQKSSKPVLQVDSVSNQFSGKPVLQDISFQLEEGEILCLLGSSGSGKTTLLRLIAGLESDYTGYITYNGTNIQAKPPHKRGFGLMFQEYALFPHKSVAENIAFGLEMKNIDQDQAGLRVSKMLELVGLVGFEDRRIDELSGGEQQRVALARSLAPEPQLLLLDEPLGSLDRTLRERLTIEIRAILKKLKLTAIFVTHDQSEAFGIADKIAVLQDGKLQQFSRPEELYRNPANEAVARFLGFTNIFHATYDQRNQILKTPIGGFSVEIFNHQLPKTIQVLIRPEGARISDSTEQSEPGNIHIEGIVLSRRYQGSSYSVEVEINSYQLSFDLPLDPSPPDIGEVIKLIISKSTIVYLRNSPPF